MLEMTIDSIRVSPMNYQRVVILKEKNAKIAELFTRVQKSYVFRA